MIAYRDRFDSNVSISQRASPRRWVGMPGKLEEHAMQMLQPFRAMPVSKRIVLALGILWAASASSGEKLAQYKLDAPPAWDGLAAANGMLFLAMADGRVLCMGPQ